ncbi:calmodulin-lysine N-methyltransferase-like [Limulus polyphemus]|uniref:Calmodulin-lysine N-methyltransferase n=1 Tax=Limulus polyphemus TaxID=6850 RepID=A0ABM1SU47_LIMPO|nr:calmodulin-lysine N-methyltransferase-like [Limulus polyphemus]XP_022247152.1 calmodulin-lysine N-methyltransferase-like [Limulus polyphemus]XP_022247153.1 calmodulin-lysine N-methyltransferase-like [Limulus polyphemus]
MLDMEADVREISRSYISSELPSSRSISIAKMRWKILAKALQEGRVQDLDVVPGSVRQFSTFGLVRMISLRENEACDPEGRWYECSCSEDAHFRLHIRILSNKVTVDELMGFDNTGNVCIWPSEEVLAYYCMKNKEAFERKSVCELGGGMTCLSGFAVAATGGAKEVFLTDGNMRSVKNVQVIVERNSSRFNKTRVISRLLRWDEEEDLQHLKQRFDYVVCADCMYFDSGRILLINTIWKIIKDTGLAVVLAPTRGNSFQKFVDEAQQKFHIEKLMIYDIHLWDLHIKLKKKKPDLYDENLHYPQMLLLRKL